MLVVLAPRTKTSPREVRSTPLSAFSSVDFPAPFGPTTAVIFPGYTLSETSSMTGGPPYPAHTPSARSTGPVCSAMAEVHAEVGVDDPGVVTQPGEGPLRDHLAEVHHHHLVAGLLDERQVVLYDDHGLARGGELAHGVADLGAQDRVDAAHGLVEDDQPRLRGGHAGELQQALLAAAERARARVPEIGQAEPLQDRAGPRPVRLLRPAEAPGQAEQQRLPAELAAGQQHVVHDGQAAPL